MATTLEVGLGTVEIDNADVVRLVLQYLREAGLTSAAAELERRRLRYQLEFAELER